MKAKPKTKNFSTRLDTLLLETFDSIIENKGKNRNNVINDLILNYISEHSKDKEYFQPISIVKISEKLGYKRTLFTREDAEFLIEGLKVIDSKSNFLKEYGSPYDENSINEMVATGIKYSFENIGIYIYSHWHFAENRNSENLPIIDKFHYQYVYDKKSEHFFECEDIEFLPFNLKENL